MMEVSLRHTKEVEQGPPKHFGMHMRMNYADFAIISNIPHYTIAFAHVVMFFKGRIGIGLVIYSL